MRNTAVEERRPDLLVRLRSEASRIRWGNDANRHNNGGQTALVSHLRAAWPEIDPTAAELVAQMDSLGFAMWPQRHDPELISRIWAGYQDTIDDDRACLDMGSRIPEAVRYICNPLERIPEIRGLLDEKARSVLDHHYGGHWRVESVRVWRTGYLPPAERRYHHYGNLWHCDQHPISRQKLFVQIQGDESLARTEDSAFRFHDVKSTRQLMRAGYVGPGQIYGPARRMIEDPNHIIKFDRPSGSAIFCNTTRCVHRAGVPAEGTTRGMVQFMFVASDTLRPGLLDDGDVLDIGPDTGVVPGRFA